MALGGYRTDPILGSLSELRDSLRSASSDALTRRRLDLSEQTLLGQLSQEKELAGLRRLTQEQQGETTLLKTKSDVETQRQANARAQRQLELAEGADVRAGEMHGLNLQKGAFELESAKQLLPLEIAGKRSDIAYKGALAAESNVRKQMNAYNLQQSREQQEFLNRPIQTEQIDEMLKTNPEFDSIFRLAYRPGEQLTIKDLQYGFGMVEKMYSPEVAQMGAATVERQINDPNTPPEQLPILLQKRQQLMERAGRRTEGGDEGMQNLIAHHILAATKATDPATRQDLFSKADTLMRGLAAMQQKGGRLPATTEEFLKSSGLSLDTIEKLRADTAGQQGYMLGSVEDYLIERGNRQRPVLPNGSPYATPNEVYRRVAPMVKPATSAEWEGYREKDATIDTQEKANTVKRDLEVMAVHQRTGGDEVAIKRLLAGSTQAQPNARGTSLEGALGPAPAAPAPQATPNNPFGGAQARTQQEIAAQLQQELGREPTAEEIEARYQQLLQPRGTMSLQSLGEFFRTRRPSDLLGGSRESLPSGVPAEGFLGPQQTPSGSTATALMETITEPGVNGGRPTNIPLLVPGQKDIDSLLAGNPPTREQLEIAMQHAIQRTRRGESLPTYETIDQAVEAAKAESEARGRLRR